MPIAAAVLMSAFALRSSADETVPLSPEHAKLAARAGTFDVTGTAWSPVNNARISISGTSRARMILDGKFLQETTRGEMAGQSFTGLELTGFNTASKVFTTTFMDSTGTGTITMRGRSQPGNEIILRGRIYDPAMRKMTRVKSVTTVVSRDEYRREVYSNRGGSEKKVMELVYRRRN
jgi:hypothetical protein